MASPDYTEPLSDQLIEQMAAIEHERWSHWQRYMHAQGERQPDGSLHIPADLVARWERQMATPFAALTAEEKASDRAQVERYLPLVLAAMATQDRR